MASRLHLSEVMEQINDDSDWYNSDDDQDGDLEFDISWRDPLDRAADKAEHDEGGCTSTQSPIHLEDEEDNEQEDDKDNLSESSKSHQSSTSTQQVLGQTTDLWDPDDFLPAPGPKLNMEPDSHPYEFFCKVGDLPRARRADQFVCITEGDSKLGRHE